MSNARVLVIGIQSNIGLATLWSLAPRGIDCFGVSLSRNGVGLSSRFLKKGYFVPFMHEYSMEFVKKIIDICDKDNIEGVMCHHEAQMVLLNQHRHQIEKKTKLFFPPKEILDSIINKDILMNKAKEVGIRVPANFLIRSKADAIKAYDQVQFPAIIKNSTSICHNLPDKWSFKTKYFSSREEWRRFASDFPNNASPFLLQEYILGKYIGVGQAMEKGNSVAQFQWTALREHEPGLGSLRLSVPLNPRIAQHAENLCRHLNFNGVCEVEFRGDENQPVLMEINPRLWGGTRLPIFCGVDFPYLAYLIYSGRTVESILEYKTGVYSRNFLGDLKWLYKVFRGAYDHEPNMRISKSSALKNFISTIGCASVHDLEYHQDVMPALKHYFSKIFRR